MFHKDLLCLFVFWQRGPDMFLSEEMAAMTLKEIKLPDHEELLPAPCI